MLKSVCVLFSVLLVAPLASAEVFQCVGKYGEALYQNFPCQFVSMGGMPMDAPGPKESPADVPGAKKLPTDVPGAKKSPAASAAPRAGMTGDEVRAVWGEPTEIIQEEPGEAVASRSGHMVTLALCALIAKGACPPYKSRMWRSGGLIARQTKRAICSYRPLSFRITLSRSTGVVYRIKS